MSKAIVMIDNQKPHKYQPIIFIWYEFPHTMQYLHIISDHK